MMSKLNFCEQFRKSPGGTCLLPGWHPARRWHDLPMGFNKELGNLSFRCQGERSSIKVQEPITEANHRDGPTGISDEATVMVVERSGWVIRYEALNNYETRRI